MTHADSHADEQDAATQQRLEFGDTVAIETDKTTLWAAISDPEVLTECVPGAEEIDRVSERAYTLEITRGISHLTISLSGEFELVEMHEPDHIVASGSAYDPKTASDFDVLAGMEMRERDGGGTALTYQAEVTYTGGVASLGTRLLRPIVKRDVDTYFDNVRAAVESEKAP